VYLHGLHRVNRVVGDNDGVAFCVCEGMVTITNV
jgi:hypothetical protein